MRQRYSIGCATGCHEQLKFIGNDKRRQRNPCDRVAHKFRVRPVNEARAKPREYYWPSAARFGAFSSGPRAIQRETFSRIYIYIPQIVERESARRVAGGSTITLVHASSKRDSGKPADTELDRDWEEEKGQGAEGNRDAIN